MTLRAQRWIAACGVALLLASLFGARALTAAAESKPEPKSAAKGAEKTGGDKAGAIDETQPSSRLIAELRRRTEELERRERELREREHALGELNEEARATLAELDRRGKQVEERLAAIEKLQGDGIGRLAKVYAGMPPGNAALLLEKLDLEVATAVLARMKPKVSASVLAAMRPERALELTLSSVVPLMPGAPGAAAAAPAAATPDVTAQPPAAPADESDPEERYR